MGEYGRIRDISTAPDSPATGPLSPPTHVDISQGQILACHRLEARDHANATIGDIMATSSCATRLLLRRSAHPTTRIPARHLLRLTALVGSAALTLAACSGGNVAELDDAIERGDGTFVQLSVTNVTATDGVRTATRTLGLDLIAQFPGQTVVTSPASAVVALSMLGSGSSGPTDEQLASLLGASGKDRDEAVNALMGTLDPYRAHPESINPEKLPEEPALHMANQVVASNTLHVEAEYLNNLTTMYDAGVLTADLASQEGKNILDKWVRRNTAGLIKESAVQPSPALRMVLQNAILFASKWSIPFEEKDTYEEDFTTASGDTVSTDFMHDTRTIDYASVEGWQMIDLPYGSEGNLVARYILPPQGTEVEAATVDVLASLEKMLAPALINLTIPKLDLASALELSAPLQQLGLISIFSDTPPALRNISTAEDLFVSLVVQQGRVRIDEEGTIAAAVTEIALESTSAPIEGPDPIEFRADRPHLILLLDKNVNWDLFQIAVNDPTVK